MKKYISNFKRFKFFLNNCKKEIIIFLILSFIATILSVFLPTISGIMINNILNKEFNLVIVFLIISALVKVVNVICNLLSTKIFLKLRKKMVLNIRKYVCNITLNLSINVFHIYGQGNFLNKIQSDTSRISNYFTVIKDSFLSIFSSFGTLIVILFLNPIIGLYFFICCVITFLIRYYGIKKSLYYKNINLKKLDDNSNLLSQIYRGVKDIKTLNLKDNFKEKTNDSFENISELEYKSNYYLDYYSKITNFLESIFLGGMILLSMLLIKNELLTTSTFILILMNRGKVFNFTTRLSTLVNNFGQFDLSFNRIISILDYDRESFGKKKIGKLEGNIEFKNVSFSYDNNNEIISNFNLIINKNSFNTIIGDNGSGKSTLFSLITKMYSLNSGKIFLDNYDINELDEESIRNNIALVTQQPFLFNLSIKENLELIDNNFGNIKRVCKIVGLDKKINSLEKKYDSILNDDATNFSGGEKQRLAIARVLLTNAKILLFDEITNNLDRDAIKSINELIDKLKGKYTIIMITHDIECIKNSDRIIILKKGKIIGDGDHNNLLKNNKFYKKINSLKK